MWITPLSFTLSGLLVAIVSSDEASYAAAASPISLQFIKFHDRQLVIVVITTMIYTIVSYCKNVALLFSFH